MLFMDIRFKTQTNKYLKNVDKGSSLAILPALDDLWAKRSVSPEVPSTDSPVCKFYKLRRIFSSRMEEQESSKNDWDNLLNLMFKFIDNKTNRKPISDISEVKSIKNIPQEKLSEFFHLDPHANHTRFFNFLYQDKMANLSSTLTSFFNQILNDSQKYDTRRFDKVSNQPAIPKRANGIVPAKYTTNEQCLLFEVINCYADENMNLLRICNNICKDFKALSKYYRKNKRKLFHPSKVTKYTIITEEYESYPQHTQICNAKDVKVLLRNDKVDDSHFNRIPSIKVPIVEHSKYNINLDTNIFKLLAQKLADKFSTINRGIEISTKSSQSTFSSQNTTDYHINENEIISSQIAKVSKNIEDILTMTIKEEPFTKMILSTEIIPRNISKENSIRKIIPEKDINTTNSTNPKLGRKLRNVQYDFIWFSKTYLIFRNFYKREGISMKSSSLENESGIKNSYDSSLLIPIILFLFFLVLSLCGFINRWKRTDRSNNSSKFDLEEVKVLGENNEQIQENTCRILVPFRSDGLLESSIQAKPEPKIDIIDWKIAIEHIEALAMKKDLMEMSWRIQDHPYKAEHLYRAIVPKMSISILIPFSPIRCLKTSNSYRIEELLQMIQVFFKINSEEIITQELLQNIFEQKNMILPIV